MSSDKSSNNPLHKLMSPKSVVMAGASSNFMKMGSIQALNLLNSGFAGEVVFVHPTEKTVMGRPAYRDPADIPFVPDLAMLVTPTRVTPDLIDKLGQRGVKYAVITTAGFKEVGGDGVELEKRLSEIADRHGMRFVGPNCIGVLNTANNLNLTVCPYMDKPGGLGLISQSGTYVAQTMPYLQEVGIRYSQAISVGNATNIDVVDCLEYLGEDENTRAVAMYIEGIKRGDKFIETARKVARIKPIVALYAGGTKAGSRSGFSHTGSLGGPNKLYDGIFEQAGIIRASTVEEMFGWGNTLANMPPPKGRNIAILTHSGGPATSMADACEKHGLNLPIFSESLQDKIRPFIELMASARNPVDLTFSMDHENFVIKIPEILFGSDEVDAVLIHGMMDTGFAEMMYETVKNNTDIAKDDFLKMFTFKLDPLMALPKKSGKPLVASNFLRRDHAAQTFKDSGIPLFRTPESAAAAMAVLMRYGEIKKRLAKQKEPAGPVSKSDFVFNPGVMDEYSAKKVLAKFGVPIAKQTLAQTLGAALAFAVKTGYPVVLKGLPEGFAHKSDSGLVHLDLRNDDALCTAWETIQKIAPGCSCVVARMVPPERELVVGMKRFAGFGPCVMLGIGGIFTEAIQDAVFRMAPVSKTEAIRMADSLRLKKLLAPQRGLPGVDMEKVAEIIMAVGDLALSHPEISEIDINPIMIEDGSPVAVDALIVVDD